jgi:hypothetical protein
MTLLDNAELETFRKKFHTLREDVRVALPPGPLRWEVLGQIKKAETNAMQAMDVE